MKTIRTFINQTLFGLAFIGVTSVIAQPAMAEKFTGQSSNVRAEISFEKSEE
ncbi:hypothetical protein [Anabaena subtropica]|uniref:Uncharacterized protein n=1 Tax=Anabaena subtropica FACHB-260 TaxID=2692884 RepID=A0ABR8CTD4_9NOST|nr:hypothetical protein [Anabaena subtropica]MBD2346447.1 hypothetical protein [Anabaena subtropica FACHB-260]